VAARKSDKECLLFLARPICVVRSPHNVLELVRRPRGLGSGDDRLGSGDDLECVRHDLQADLTPLAGVVAVELHR
jgi:hypothetical protein